MTVSSSMRSVTFEACVPIMPSLCMHAGVHVHSLQPAAVCAKNKNENEKLQVVTDIIHFHNTKLDVYKGDYFTFERTVEERKKRQERVRTFLRFGQKSFPLLPAQLWSICCVPTRSHDANHTLFVPGIRGSGNEASALAGVHHQACRTRQQRTQGRVLVVQSGSRRSVKWNFWSDDRAHFVAVCVWLATALGCGTEKISHEEAQTCWNGNGGKCNWRKIQNVVRWRGEPP